MWIENGKRLIALDGRDVRLEHRDIVFEGRSNIEVIRYPSEQTAKVQYKKIVRRLSDRIITQV